MTHGKTKLASAKKRDGVKAVGVKSSKSEAQALPRRLAATLAVCRPASTPKREFCQGVLDLFGDVPVTQRDVEVWLFNVPKLPHYLRNRSKYVTDYNVVSKIARAKKDGTWQEAVGDECCEFCGQELAQHLAPAPVNDAGGRAMLQEEIKRLRRRAFVLEMLLLQPPETNETQHGERSEKRKSEYV